MAVWQWDLWMIPQKEVLKHFISIPQYVDLDWFEMIEWWNTTSQKKLEDFFETILSLDIESSTTISKEWGKVDETCIRLMVENNKITDVFIRIDVRQLNIDFIKALIDFAEEHDFLFFTLESNKFIKPLLRTFIDELKTSKAMLFVEDPRLFFNDKAYLDKINKENRRKIK